MKVKLQGSAEKTYTIRKTALNTMQRPPIVGNSSALSNNARGTQEGFMQQKPPMPSILAPKARINAPQRTGVFDDILTQQTSQNVTPFAESEDMISQKSAEVAMLQKALTAALEENLKQKNIIKERDEKLKALEDENKKLRRDKIQLQNKIVSQEDRVRSLEHRLHQIQRAEGQRNQQQAGSGGTADVSDRRRQADEMRNMMLAMRLQALESFPLMLLPEEAFRHQDRPRDPNDIDPDNMTYEQLLELQERIGYVSKGLTKEQIKQIPKLQFSAAHKRHGESCTICVSDFQAGEKIRRLKCNHQYHSACIKGWLVNEKTCPVCKGEVVTQSAN